MNAPITHSILTDLDIWSDAHAACARIAPNWPLDRLIAVNPWWHFTHLPFATATAELRRLGGISTHARTIAADALRQGTLMPAHVAAAVRRKGAPLPVDTVLAAAARPAPARPRFPLVTDLVDAARDTRHAMSWNDFVVHQIGQQCAAYFDADQARWRAPGSERLYSLWHEFTRHDHAPRLLLGHRTCRARADALPNDPRQAIAFVARALGVPATLRADYFTALLLGVNGWAAWCAYLSWQANLDGQPIAPDEDPRLDLLAMRLAWEYLIADRAAGEPWREAWCAYRPAEAAARAHADGLVNETLLAAQEIAWQDTVCAGLAQAPRPALVATPAAASRASGPSVQAVFCIDVRSEPLRRALEAVAPTVETRGFAGFFGLPIDYAPLGADAARPQLPGLLAPALRAREHPRSDAESATIATARRQRAQTAARWGAFRASAASAFTFVETLGLSYAWQLLKRSLPATQAPYPGAHRDLPAPDPSTPAPRLADAPLDVRADVAAKVLAAMGLQRGLADIVLLVGHGSSNANNPHAAALDCGACGGQTGEVNARVAAALLNEPDVRAELVRRGIEVPAGTRFVPALHDTTTDEVTLFDQETAAADPALDALRANLAAAGRRARAERAPSLGLAALATDNAALLRAVRARANDWAQVRPEWGLANNAAFIAAPRARTRHMNLQGRAFLHDYRHADDADGRTLELIMTAPMVVAHWINLQYYASTVDNARFGCGNKVLHNVVGGRIGVFEGNGGDLRIGLPMQSLHDGTRWRHTPLRLSVFIEAPREAIDAVLARHATVRALVRNEWLHLFAIAPDGDALWQRGADGWTPVTSGASAAASAPRAA